MQSLPQTEHDVVDLANRTIAGGVVSMNRKVSPRHVFRRARGSRLWDINGREYIDFHAAFAPFILGHNYPAVNDAVKSAMDDCWSLVGSGPTPWEARLAQLICEAVPSVDLVQIANTGSEAVALAVRLSNAFTEHEEIIVTLGGYNGWQNEVARAVMPTLEEIGPRRQNSSYRFVPSSAGLPTDIARRVHVVNFNDLESVETLLKKGTISCVLTEPVLQNVGVVLPKPGYLEELIQLCERYGALCVFDEVKTGFRTSLGGYQGAAGLRPHLSVFGKAVANGYPLSVIGGRAEVMQLFDAPEREKRVLIAGTYNAHPMVCAAGIATLNILREQDVYSSIKASSDRLYQGLENIFMEAGITAIVARNASAFCVYFSEHAPENLHDILNFHDFDLDLRYRRGLVEKGIYHLPVPCKQGSVSFSHTVGDIDRTLDATRDVVTELRRTM